jgi:hypothetical protein
MDKVALEHAHLQRALARDWEDSWLPERNQIPLAASSKLLCFSMHIFVEFTILLELIGAWSVWGNDARTNLAHAAPVTLFQNPISGLPVVRPPTLSLFGGTTSGNSLSSGVFTQFICSVSHFFFQYLFKSVARTKN